MKSEFDDVFPNKDLAANKYVTLFSFFIILNMKWKDLNFLKLNIRSNKTGI